MLRVGDRNFLDQGIEQGVNAELLDVNRKVIRHPENQSPHRVTVKRIFIGHPFFDQLRGVAFIGGEKDVKRRAVLDLSRQVPGSAERQLYVLSCFLGVGRRNSRESGRQVSRCRDRYLLRGDTNREQQNGKGD